MVALLAEGVDRNLMVNPPFFVLVKVALLAECVDRNIVSPPFVILTDVALLAEGVDRNDQETVLYEYDGIVALLAEGVDRNKNKAVDGITSFGRPPRGGRG